MAANVETMMYVREKPWHGLGTMVAEAPSSAEALQMAGLDWVVNQEDVKDARGLVIPGYKANVRSSDNRVLGIVGSRYQVVQNTDAFQFTDELIGGDVRYETAGALRNGRQIWLLARMQPQTVAGDDVEPYLCFTNTHDGSGAVRVCMTPVRVVCNNTLNVALRSAKRYWSMRHTESISGKLAEASDCLRLANQYMERLSDFAAAATKKLLPDEELSQILGELFPITDKTTDRQKTNIQKVKDEFMVCYFAPDISKFRGTAWGAINAMADMVSHNYPHKETKNYAENNWGRIMTGHSFVDAMAERVMR